MKEARHMLLKAEQSNKKNCRGMQQNAYKASKAPTGNNSSSQQACWLALKSIRAGVL
jgi:hypothetical protein